MFQRLMGFLAKRAASSNGGGGAEPVSSTAAAAERTHNFAPTQVIHYPPKDPGLVLVNQDALLNGQAELIRALRIHCAVPEPLFDTKYLGPVRRMAATVSSLPGSPNGVFAGSGGLFRASLEMAFNAYRASDGRIFTGDLGVEKRHALEGRWRYVCFSAAMLYPVGLPLQAMTVLNGTGARWANQLDPLLQWVKAGDHVWLAWPNDRIEPGPSPFVGQIAQQIIGRENIEWLNEGDPELWQRLIEIATGSPASMHLIATGVIKQTWQSIHERETSRLYQHYGRLTSGTHVSPYLIDALVTLSKGKWVLNENVLFCDGKTAFLEWPQAGRDIIAFCGQRDYKGIPTSESALLSMLLQAKIVQGESDGLPYQEIAGQGGEIVTAVRLAKMGLVIEDVSAVAKVFRPVALDRIVAADPLAQKVIGSPTPAPVANPQESPVKEQETKHAKPAETDNQKPPAKQPVKVRPTLDTLVIKDDPPPQPSDHGPAPVIQNDLFRAPATDHPVAGSGAAEPAKSTPSVAVNPSAPLLTTGKRVNKVTAPSGSAPALHEAAEVSYSEVVPADLRGKLKPFSAEILGKVISWVNEVDKRGNWMIRRVDKGIAVEKDLIFDFSNKAVDAVMSWAEAGWLYIDLSRPGMKFHSVAKTEGGADVCSCVIFTTSAATRLGMKDVG